VAALNPDPITKATQETKLGPGIHAQRERSSPMWTFRPYAIGFIGLAIAVFLWGFGYKLSLYHPHPTPTSQASVAKMWVKSRNDLAAGPRKLNATQDLIPGSQVFVASGLQLTAPAKDVPCGTPEVARTAATSVFLIPSRSPPSSCL
jgi:hypothetical protein